VVCVVLAWRRRWILALATGTAGVAGFVVPALGNAALERAAVGGAIRSSRAAGTAAAGGSGLGERLREGVVTLTSPFPSFGRSYILVGVLGAAALVVAAAYAGTGGDRRRAQLAGLGVLIVVITRLASGLGFWPGMLATTPMAGVGLGRGWADARRRLLLALGL